MVDGVAALFDAMTTAVQVGGRIGCNRAVHDTLCRQIALHKFSRFDDLRMLGGPCVPPSGCTDDSRPETNRRETE